MSSHTQNYNPDLDLTTVPDFTSLKGYIGLPVFHQAGGELYDGMEVFCERNARTPITPAILKSWKIGSVKMDLTGFGKYAESTVVIIKDGKEQTWPISMIYIKEK